MEKKKAWVGVNVIYEGKQYVVLDVDYNGALLIDRPTYFDDGTMIKKDTAISEYDIEKIV